MAKAGLMPMSTCGRSCSRAPAASRHSNSNAGSCRIWSMGASIDRSSSRRAAVRAAAAGTGVLASVPVDECEGRKGTGPA